MPEYEGPGEVEYAAKIAALGRVGGRLSRPTQTQILEEKKRGLESELERVNKALDALKAHPEIETVMNLVAQAL